MKAKIILLCLLFTPSLALASGGGGGGSYGSSSFNQPVVDPAYERGKALYTGRAKGVPKIKYCVAVDGAFVKVKKSSMKQFKGASAQVVADQLVNCDATDKKLLNYVDAQQASLALYYLDKRYKLKMK